MGYDIVLVVISLDTTLFVLCSALPAIQLTHPTPATSTPVYLLGFREYSARLYTCTLYSVEFLAITIIV